MSSKKTDVAKIGINYGGVLFSIAKDKSALDEVRDHFKIIMESFNQNPKLLKGFGNKIVDQTLLSQKFESILKKFEVNTILESVLLKTMKNGRMYAVSAIYKRYNELYMAEKNIAEVEIISKYPVNDNQISEIETFIKKEYNCETEIATSIEDKMIGGVIVKIHSSKGGSEIIDLSVSNKLMKIKNLFKTMES